MKELSVLSIDKIVMLVKEKVEGILGEADDDLKREVNAKIAQCLMFHENNGLKLSGIGCD